MYNATLKMDEPNLSAMREFPLSLLFTFPISITISSLQRARNKRISLGYVLYNLYGYLHIKEFLLLLNTKHDNIFNRF